MNAGPPSLEGLEANLARAGVSSSADAPGARRARSGFRDVEAELLDQTRLTEDRRVGRAPRPDRIVSALLGPAREIDLCGLAGAASHATAVNDRGDARRIADATLIA